MGILCTPEREPPRFARWLKKLQEKSEAAMRTPMKRASKQAPTWYSWPLASRSLWSYDPIPRMILVWGHKDLFRVGAHFEALCKGILMAACDFSCNFFHILTSGFEQCDRASYSWSRQSQMHSPSFMRGSQNTNEILEIKIKKSWMLNFTWFFKNN